MSIYDQRSNGWDVDIVAKSSLDSPWKAIAALIFLLLLIFLWVMVQRSTFCRALGMVIYPLIFNTLIFQGGKDERLPYRHCFYPLLPFSVLEF